jgi:hypothetical protein
MWVQLSQGEEMSKSKFGNSNLYMTTQEFADLVIEALHEQNYFKKNEPAHPGDICVAFSTVAETIGSAMTWAISQEHQYRKEAVMKPMDLRKVALPNDDEIAPFVNEYSESKFAKGS